MKERSKDYKVASDRRYEEMAQITCSGALTTPVNPCGARQSMPLAEAAAFLHIARASMVTRNAELLRCLDRSLLLMCVRWCSDCGE